MPHKLKWFITWLTNVNNAIADQLYVIITLKLCKIVNSKWKANTMSQAIKICTRVQGKDKLKQFWLLLGDDSDNGNLSPLSIGSSIGSRSNIDLKKIFSC